MIRPTIGLDWDDVTAPFNSIAVKMANEKYSIEPPLTLEEVTSWNNTGRASIIKEFYGDIELYNHQKPTTETIEWIRKLMTFADVYFISAVSPEFMTIRAMQIQEAFPEIGVDRIILGTAKNKVHFDIVLDDAIHNVLESSATYPVLMRKPWNHSMTGILSVNNMAEFVSLVSQILFSLSNINQGIKEPCVLALVGPSGSGKNKVVEDLVLNKSCERPNSYCTKDDSKHHISISEENFKKANFFEHTMYGGYHYGTYAEDIECILNKGKFAVLPLDMCGAIAMKMRFPTTIIYITKCKESLVMDIISDETLSNEEKKLRILSLDTEKKNKPICDITIDNSDNKASKKLTELINSINL